MLYSAKGLEGYTIRATDGDIGHIDQLYFEQESWLVRYLVVDVGNWLISNKVLLIPGVIEHIDADGEVASVSLTKQQVKVSPSIDLSQPVSREKELALHQHYNWSPYWQVDLINRWAFGTYPAEPLVSEPPAPPPGEINPEAAEVAQEAGTSSDLYSSDEVIGYHIEAEDGHIGRVEDLLIDDERWAIRYMVVDTGTWLPGRKVLVASTWVTGVRWEDEDVSVALTRETMKNSPAYDPERMIDRDYERALHQHYGKPTYW